MAIDRNHDSNDASLFFLHHFLAMTIDRMAICEEGHHLLAFDLGMAIYNENNPFAPRLSHPLFLPVRPTH